MSKIPTHLSLSQVWTGIRVAVGQAVRLSTVSSILVIIVHAVFMNRPPWKAFSLLWDYAPKPGLLV